MQANRVNLPNLFRHPLVGLIRRRLNAEFLTNERLDGFKIGFILIIAMQVYIVRRLKKVRLKAIEQLFVIDTPPRAGQEPALYPAPELASYAGMRKTG